MLYNSDKVDPVLVRPLRSALNDELFKLIGIMLAELESFVHALPLNNGDDTATVEEPLLFVM